MHKHWATYEQECKVACIIRLVRLCTRGCRTKWRGAGSMDDAARGFFTFLWVRLVFAFVFTYKLFLWKGLKVGFASFAYSFERVWSLSFSVTCGQKRHKKGPRRELVTHAHGLAPDRQQWTRGLFVCQHRLRGHQHRHIYVWRWLCFHLRLDLEFLNNLRENNPCIFS